MMAAAAAAERSSETDEPATGSAIEAEAVIEETVAEHDSDGGSSGSI